MTSGRWDLPIRILLLYWKNFSEINEMILSVSFAVQYSIILFYINPWIQIFYQTPKYHLFPIFLYTLFIWPNNLKCPQSSLGECVLSFLYSIVPRNGANAVSAPIRMTGTVETEQHLVRKFTLLSVISVILGGLKSRLWIRRLSNINIHPWDSTQKKLVH